MRKIISCSLIKNEIQLSLIEQNYKKLFPTKEAFKFIYKYPRIRVFCTSNQMHLISQRDNNLIPIIKLPDRIAIKDNSWSAPTILILLDGYLSIRPKNNWPCCDTKWCNRVLNQTVNIMTNNRPINAHIISS